MNVQVLSKPSELRPLDRDAIKKTRVMVSSLQESHGVKLVDVVNAANYRVSCNSEIGRLRTAVVSLPTYLDWDKPITDGEDPNNKPDRYVGVCEHARLITTLSRAGVEVVLIRPGEDRLEGVYTRDIGIVIGDKFIHANLVAAPRQAEEKNVAGGIKPPPEVKLEGGNVMVVGEKNLVLVGVGKRTNEDAVKWLQETLGTDYEVKPIKLKDMVLHLDCVFSPIEFSNGSSRGAGLVYSYGFESAFDLAFLSAIYGRLIEVEKDECCKMGANTFALDPKTRIANPNCPKVISALQEMGQNVVPIKLDEIIKGEGYARCSVMPLWRE